MKFKCIYLRISRWLSIIVNRTAEDLLAFYSIANSLITPIAEDILRQKGQDHILSFDPKELLDVICALLNPLPWISHFNFTVLRKPLHM